MESPDTAIARLASRLQVLGTEQASIGASSGRVLREPIRADRDSPAADVSAMDGYAVRLADLQQSGPLNVVGESRPGHAPPTPDASAVMRVFTGGIVPGAFDAVIRREDTVEQPASIRLLEPAKQAPVGLNIRRRGENGSQGAAIVPAGTLLSAGSIAAAANFGAAEVTVTRPVRISILVTGDELRFVDQTVQPWQLRDSNGHSLEALLNPRPWIKTLPARTAADALETISGELHAALAISDAVVLTGGVSMGDHDHVPAAVRACGGEVVFHRLPLRPGKPILGAATGEGKLILGLPGNPVSATVCARRFLLPLLGSIAGQSAVPRPAVRFLDPHAKQLPLWWMRLVRLNSQGLAEPVPTMGSGDLVSLANSDGFIEQPPRSTDADASSDATASDAFEYWSWTSS